MPREADPQEVTAVEGMNQEQFAVYVENRRGCLSSLPYGVPDYGAKKKLLQHAVDTKRTRAVSALTVKVNAAGENLTLGLLHLRRPDHSCNFKNINL